MSSLPVEKKTTSTIRPLGDRVVVKVLEQEERTASGILVPDTAKEKPQRGRVLAVGNGAYVESSTERRPLDLAPGDTIIFSKYSGTEVKVDGEELLILGEHDILAVVDR
jgi:chaperonin GroES